MKSLIMTRTARRREKRGSYSRQVFLAVGVINVYVNTEREAPQQKCELSTSTMQAQSETGGIRGEAAEEKVYTQWERR